MNGTLASQDYIMKFNCCENELLAMRIQNVSEFTVVVYECD